MSDEAGSSTPLVQSKLARARAGRGSMLGPTPAAKKLAKPVPFGGVQTLPRRSPDASRSLIQANSRLSRNLTSPTSRQVQLSPKTEARRKTTAAGRYSEASQRSIQMFRPPKQLPGAGRTTVSGIELRLLASDLLAPLVLLLLLLTLMGPCRCSGNPWRIVRAPVIGKRWPAEEP